MPLVHVDVPHTVPFATYLQAEALTPSHEPPHSSPVKSQGVRLPCGSPLTALQMPSLPALSQAAHCPLHDVSQHKPSTQNPELQMPLESQVAPLASFFLQLISLQK